MIHSVIRGNFYDFDVFNMDDGLNHGTVTTIYQDYRGFLWIGTPKGLNRYDGSQFKKYSAGRTLYHLSANFINDISGDSTGLLILTNESVEFFNFRTNQFTDFGNIDSLFLGNLQNIRKTKSGNFWINNQTTFLKFDHRGNILMTIDLRKSIPELQQVMTFELINNNIWIGTLEKGLIKYNLKTGKYVQFSKESQFKLAYNRVQDIFLDNDSTLWVSTWSEGFNKYDPTTNQFINFGYDSGLNTDHTETIEQFQDKDLIIGTWGSGINAFDLKNEKVYNSTNNEYIKKFFEGKNIRCSYKDSQGNIWFGTQMSGMLVLYNNQKKFKSFTIPGYEKLLDNNNANFIRFHNNKYFIGTEKNGLAIYDPISAKTTFINKSTFSGMPSNKILSIAFDKKWYWIGTKFGLIRHNFKTHKNTNMSLFEGTKNFNNYIINVINDSDSTLILLSNNVYKINKFTKKIIAQTYDDIKLWSIEKFDKYYYANSGTQGAYILDENLNTVRHFSKTNSVLLSNVTHSFEKENDRIWLGTDEGLFYIDSNHRMHQIDKPIINKYVIYQMLNSGAHLWCATNNGLVSLNKNTFNTRIFGKNNYFPHPQFIDKGGAIDSDGYLYFLSQSGIIFFDDETISKDKYSPKPVFTDLKLFNEPLKNSFFYKDRKILDQALEYTKKININYDDIFTIKFSSLNLIHPDNNWYAYKLIGIDKQWTYLDGKNEVLYNHLPYGKYVFVVKSANHDKVWSARPAELEIIIKPPYWQTPFFKILIIVSVLLILVSIFHIKGLAARRKHQFLQEMNQRLKREALYRKKTEQKLRDTNIFLDSILRSTYEVAIIVTDKDGVISFFNKGAEKITGYSSDEVMGKETPLIFHDEKDLANKIAYAKEKYGVNLSKKAIISFLSQKEKNNIHWISRTKDNRKIYLNLFMTPMVEESGEKTGNLGLATDITEQVIYEKNIKESRRKMSTLLSNIQGMAYRCAADKNWTMEYVSQGSNKLTGYTPEEIINNKKTSFYEIIYTEDRDSNRPLINQSIIDKCPFELTYRIKTKSNQVKWVWEKGRAVFDDDGNFAALEGFIVDVNETIIIKQELEKTKNYINSIINSIQSKIVTIDANGNITHLNKEMKKMIPLSSSEIIGKKITAIFPAYHFKIDELTACITSQKPTKLDNQKRQVNGQTIIEKITVFPLLVEKDQGAVIHIHDITEEIHLQEMMIQSEKMLSIGGLAAGMAHEINNPLAGMIQNAQVLKNRLLKKSKKNLSVADIYELDFSKIIHYLTDRKIDKLLNLIIKSGNHASGIVNNMLSFAKQSRTNFDYHDPINILEQTIELAKNDYNVKKKYDFKKITLMKKYAKNLPQLYCSSSKLQQVFLNIIKNGSEAIYEEINNHPNMNIKSKQFIFRIYSEKNHIVYEIENNGPALPPELKNRIFEPFFTTKGQKGTGLGLSVSYFIITENHKGNMAVLSDGKSGVKFIIKIPYQRKNE